MSARAPQSVDKMQMEEAEMQGRGAESIHAARQLGGEDPNGDFGKKPQTERVKDASSHSLGRGREKRDPCICCNSTVNFRVFRPILAVLGEETREGGGRMVSCGANDATFHAWQTSLLTKSG